MYVSGFNPIKEENLWFIERFRANCYPIFLKILESKKSIIAMHILFWIKPCVDFEFFEINWTDITDIVKIKNLNTQTKFTIEILPRIKITQIECLFD
jgi:hypothetical protein